MKLEIICLSLIFLAVLTITLGIIKIHTYPGKIAKERNHPQLDAIEVTSLLGLIIFPFWMVALIWAYSGAVIGTLYPNSEPPAKSDEPKKHKKHKINLHKHKAEKSKESADADNEDLPASEDK